MSNCPTFRYIAISEQSVCPEPVPRRAERLLQLGVPAVQIRDKSTSDRTRYEWTRSIEQPETGSLLINGRADMAVLNGLDGVHAPADGLETSDLRSLLDEDGIVGRSTHTREEVLRADRNGADYVTFGPVFPTESKPDLDRDSIPGVEELSEVCKLTSVPVFALGGVSTPDDIRECLDAGAYGVAGIRALFAGEDPEETWERLKPILTD